MKLLKLLLEQEDTIPIDILYDDAKSRVASFGTTHTIENPEVLSTYALKELEAKRRSLRKKNILNITHKGYVGYGWGPMWDILQDIKTSRLNNINAIFIDSDFTYEDTDKDNKTEKFPRWEYPENQRLSYYGKKTGMTSAQSFIDITNDYRKEVSSKGLGINDRDYYLPYGIGLVEYLCNHKDVGNKIKHIIVGNSKDKTADYYLSKLSRIYGGKVRRIRPGILHKIGYIV